MAVVWEPRGKCTFTHLAALLLSHASFAVISSPAESLTDFILRCNKKNDPIFALCHKTSNK